MILTLFRCRPRCVLFAALLLIVVLVTITGAHPKLRHFAHIQYNYYVADRGTGGGPPLYTALRKWEAALPQHNLSLPFPEGKSGRYVKFSNQERVLGWNNCFNEVLMNAHLAYVSERAYVFQDYEWAHEHYQWPEDRWLSIWPRTPLTAIVSGPVAGGPFEEGDPAPRAVSANWFDVVCPRRERRYINTRDVKPAVAEASGLEVLKHWQAILEGAPERCIEVVYTKGEWFPQTFDLSLFGSPRLLNLWPSFSASPISRLLRGSPIVRSAVERNMQLFLPRGPRPPHPTPHDPFARMLALHLRRGDYEGHCRGLGSGNAVFYSWNLFPHLPDRFVSEPNAPGKDERFLARCWPDRDGVVRKAAAVRADYLAHMHNATSGASEGTLDFLYILTNEKTAWLDGLKDALRADGWTIATSQELVLDKEQTDVSMAVDMEIARRAAVFVGNGWSSFTSNIVYQRLVDKRDPITIRFT